MAFFYANTGGPDIVGGLFPGKLGPVKCINRAGATLSYGQVCMLDITAASTEITTNDSNSYLPGAGDASGDTVWNTVVDPDATRLDTGGIFGVVTDKAGIADNAIGNVQFFGFVEAMCVSAGTITPGEALTATTTNSFRDAPLSNERVIGWLAGPSKGSITTQTLTKFVFLHNGLFGGTYNP